MTTPAPTTPATPAPTTPAPITRSSRKDPMLTGIVPPLVTPLTRDGDVDTASLRALVDHVIDAGVDAVFALGSSGEAALLTDDMRRIVADIVLAAADGRVPVVVGAIEMTTLRAVQTARWVAACGAAAVVVTAPFYIRTHPVEIAAHFRAIAAAVPIPVYAYDIPAAVHTKLGAELLLDLAAEGVLAGLKDSSGDDVGLRRVLLGRRDRGLDGFSVLTGSELLVDAALAMGVDGVVPGLGNVDPHGYVRLWQYAQQGKWDDARAEQERLFRLFDLVDAGAPHRMGGGSSALGAFKAALELRGVIATHVTAPPYVELDRSEVGHVQGCLERAGLL